MPLTGVAKGEKAAERPVAPQALAKVASAIKSTEGALRHVERRLHASTDATATCEHYATTGESLKRDASQTPG